MRPFDPRLLRHARATWGFLALTVGLGTLLAGAVLAQAALLSQVLARVVLGGAGPADVSRLVTALLGVVAVRALLLWAQEVASARASARVRSQLRAALLAHVVALGPGWLGGRAGGELAQVAARGVDALDGYFARYLPQLVLTVLVPTAVLATMAWADPLSALVVLLTLPLIPFFLALVGLTTQVAQRRQWQALERLGHHFLDVVAGLATLRVFGRGPAQAERIAAVTEDYRVRTMTVLRISFLSAFVLELAATLSVALVAVSVGLRLQAGELSLATALLVLLLAPEAYLPLRQVGASYHAAAEGVAAGGRALDVLDTPLPAPGVVTELWRVGAVGLRLEGVAVAYPDRGRVLGPTDVEVHPGAVTALVGPSGGGKSSLLAVVLGLVAPEQGRVLLGPTDLREADPAAWHEQVAWCPQRPALLAGTVADNVRLGCAEATDAQVDRALHLAAADALDPRQLLGEGGVGLSAGQRQRVGLARAFCRAEVTGAGLLLLDEPTSHLDAATEARVAASLRGLAAGRCVLLVAHRGALLEQADVVVEVGARAVVA
ncbi:thiol reductant ABC exporter subunit CydD [Jannaschia sp. R86511]|uniref:thiol reductant ABC exporter subunit CydD n=1 Tax=Jannaschia sp. R86511 TaxID=3093853 RepID=UPI0036D2F5CC